MFSPRIQRQPGLLLPALVLVICVTATFFLWRMMSGAEQQRKQLETQVTAEQVKFRLEAWFDSRAAVVAQFAEEWSHNPTAGGQEFTSRAERIIQLHPGFQALNFIDEKWVIRHVVPLETNRAALNKDLHDHPWPGVREALAMTEQSRSVHRTPLIQLLQGEPGFATYATVRDPEDRLRGFINGVFGVDELVDACLSEDSLRERFHFRLVTSAGRLAYSSEDGPAGDWNGDPVVIPVRIVDRLWNLEIALSAAGRAQAATRADEMLAAVGVALSLLLAVLLWAYQARQAELAHRQQEYRLLVENQADFMIKVDPEGTVVFASPSFCRFMGLAEDQIVGRRFAEFVLPEDLEVFRQALDDVREPPHRSEGEFRVLTPSGACWTSWTGSAFRAAADHAEGFIGVGRDISQRRYLEYQLRQSQRLQAVGQLAGGIAHDFNNILQAIQGYLEFVMLDIDPQTDAYRDLEQARLATERAAVLVRQLLAFSRRQILQPSNLDLNVVVTDMLPMLEKVLGPAVPVSFIPAADPGLVKADQGQLEQILMNLTVNARDAMPDGGRLSIATGTEDLDEEFCRRHQGKRPGAYVRLDLTDTGVGMAPEIQEKLFEPFFTTKDAGVGTGLGLATVYGIIKQHEGMILVDSEPGRGTCFNIFLPRAEGQLEESVSRNATVAGPGQETILLAEDEPMLRKLGVRTLRSAGYRVIECADGQEGWDLFRHATETIDAAVLDVVMPRLDGRELAEKMRGRQPDLPVIFVSGYDSDSASGRKPPLPNSLRIAKPYERNDLLVAIRKILDDPDSLADS